MTSTTRVIAVVLLGLYVLVMFCGFLASVALGWTVGS